MHCIINFDFVYYIKICSTLGTSGRFGNPLIQAFQVKIVFTFKRCNFILFYIVQANTTATVLLFDFISRFDRIEFSVEKIIDDVKYNDYYFVHRFLYSYRTLLL